MIDVEGQVAHIVGTDAVVPEADRQRYVVDGLVPPAVVCPDSVEQVSQVLAYADQNGLSVIPWGGGTAIGLGGIPRRADIVLCMQRLARVLDYSPDDLTVTVQVGVTLGQIQTLLSEHGQMLTLDPPLLDRATVGGVLATNASGPLRYQFGMPRDLCLGIVVVYADGTVAKAGGRTVKNVAGFDMTRLHIGAYGTLGVIVEATFKVWPVAKSTVTVAGSFDSLSAAAAGAKALRMARIVLWSLAIVPPAVLPQMPSGFTVAVRLAGPLSVVGPQTQRAIEALAAAQASAPAEVPQAEEKLWPVVRDWPAVAGGSDSVMLRIGVAPSHVADVMAGVGSIASRHGLASTAMAYPGAATVYCSLSQAGDAAADAIKGMIALAKEWNGNLVVERCPVSLKEKAPMWGDATADDLTRRVKTTFDPKSTLNPGRFVGGI